MVHKAGTNQLTRHVEKCPGKTCGGPKITAFYKGLSVKPSSSHKNTILTTYARMCAVDMRAFNLVQGQGLIEFAQTIYNLGTSV